MEISGKVLREVEFRDRLRGYDTDEVDEFLEEVAVGVDELLGRLAELERGVTQPAAAEVPAPEPTFDDDAIRRTLVLAQRTADLAIKEANEEAERILSDARRAAEHLVEQATSTAQRIRTEADAEFATAVSAQLAHREELERDVRTLSTLVAEERDRIRESLGTMLRFVADNVAVSDVVVTRAAAPAPSPPSDATAQGTYEEPTASATDADAHEERPEVTDVDAFDDGLGDLDDGLGDLDALGGDDAEPAADDAPPTSAPRDESRSFTATDDVPPGAGADADEELWRRWTQSDDFSTSDRDDADPFGFDRRT